MSEQPHLRRSRWLRPERQGSRVTRLELFYDVIFVFAFLNVTGLGEEDITVETLLLQTVVLALLWWCWTGFALLGNMVRADYGALPLIGFVIMGPVFVLALAIPEAFRDPPGDLPGPVVFAVAYLAVRWLTIAAFWMVMNTRIDVVRQLWLPTIPAVVAAGLIMTAAYSSAIVDGEAAIQLRAVLWTLALVVEYAVGAFIPSSGWIVVSAGHWAERHALIVLVALGETLLALGFGPGRFGDLTLNWPVISTAVLGVALVCTLWWVHFDTLALSVEHAIHGTRDRPACRWPATCTASCTCR